MTRRWRRRCAACATRAGTRTGPGFVTFASATTTAWTRCRPRSAWRSSSVSSELRAGRARVAAAYERALGGRDWVTLPQAGADEGVDWFVYVVRLHPEIDRDRLIGRLAERGVPSRPYFAPLHLQPFYRATFGFKPGDFPITERVAASTLALPFSSRLADDDVRYVAAALRESVE